MAADHFAELNIVAHRRGDDDLSAFIIVGDHGGNVGNVAAVVFEIEAAGTDDSFRELQAHRLNQVGELVDEEVGVHAATEIPVTTPLSIAGSIERLIRREAEFGAEEHLPVNRLGVHVLGQRVVAPLAHVAVAVVAGLALHHVADLAGGDQLVGHLPARVGSRLNADGEDLAGLLDRVGDLLRFVDRVGHRLFKVHVLAGFHRLNRHQAVPVVGSGDDHRVDALVVEELAIVLGDL